MRPIKCIPGCNIEPDDSTEITNLVHLAHGESMIVNCAEGFEGIQTNALCNNGNLKNLFNAYQKNVKKQYLNFLTEMRETQQEELLAQE